MINLNLEYDKQKVEDEKPVVFTKEKMDKISFTQEFIKVEPLLAPTGLIYYLNNRYGRKRKTSF